MKNNFCITLQLFSLPTPRAKFKAGLFELTPFVIVQLEAFSRIERAHITVLDWQNWVNTQVIFTVQD